jgi:outer membrane protein assembly factor BamB
LAFVTVLVAVGALVLSSCDWAQFRYGPKGTGFNPFESTLSASNVSGLQRRWSEWSAGFPLESPPVVAKGVVYASTSNGRLEAFDARTGTARWSYSKDSPNAGSPAVANGVVYDLSRTTLYAIDAVSGTKLWSTPGLGGGFTCWLVVAQGVVYAASEEGTLAVNATTGATLWKTYTVRADAAPAVANGVVYTTMAGQTGFAPSLLSALDATTGKLLWSVPTSYQCVASSPAVAKGVVYVVGLDSSFARMLFAFNATTGAKLWAARSSQNCELVGDSSPSPAVANGVVYVAGDAPGLVAFNATTGTKLWSAQDGGGLPVVANGVVYAGGEAFSAISGTRLWRNGGWSWAVVADGVVYATDTTSGSLVAYGLPLPGAALNVSPTFPSDFGTVVDGTSSFPMTFTVSNFGGSATTVVTDTLTGADPTQFHVTADTCAQRVLAGGASCTVDVVFAPTLPGVRTATLAVNAATGGSVDADLSGTGNPLTIDPGFNDYGTQLDGTSSAPATFTVTNHSATTISPTIVLPGSPFTATSDTCTGATLTAGAACTIAVVFTPPATNSYDTDYQATISATASPGLTVTAYLSGTGTPLTIAPPTNDYGTVPVGSGSPATFTITNVSTASLPTDLSPSVVTGSGFSITSDGCSGTVLAADARCTVVVTFTPSVTGTTYHGQLTVQAFLSEATATLVGTGG